MYYYSFELNVEFYNKLVFGVLFHPLLLISLTEKKKSMGRSGNNETFRRQTSIESMKMLSIKSIKSKLRFSVDKSVTIHTRHIRWVTPILHRNAIFI